MRTCLTQPTTRLKVFLYENKTRVEYNTARSTHVPIDQNVCTR